jgi:hypothetical protein
MQPMLRIIRISHMCPTYPHQTLTVAKRLILKSSRGGGTRLWNDLKLDQQITEKMVWSDFLVRRN